MNFTTPVCIPKSPDPVLYGQQLFLMGSCFAENIGERLLRNKFRTEVNPFGILYNPFSVAGSLERLTEARAFTKEELFVYDGIWHSFSHHSRFSSSDVSECLEKINERFFPAVRALDRTDWLLITWGTAFVYSIRESGRIVSNCHKLPEKFFDRRLLSAEEITVRWTALLNRLQEKYPRLRIVITVSPIRHLRDGAPANQVSKGTLLTAAWQLSRQFPCVRYFPSYEIMMDELRDYRFYAADMVHPSETAIEYIWERFTDTFFPPETRNIMKEWNALSKALQHKPLNPESSAYKDFVMQNLFKLEEMRRKYPFFEVEKEIEALKNRLDNTGRK